MKSPKQIILGAIGGALLALGVFKILNVNDWSVNFDLLAVLIILAGVCLIYFSRKQ